MTNEEVKKLPPGTKVKFLDVWPEDAHWQNSEGRMDHWLGQTVTLREVDDWADYFQIEEDTEEFNGTGWFWQAEIIECIDDGEEFEAASELSFNTLFEVG